MKITAQEEYGLRCLLQVAKAEASITISEICKNEGISSANVAKMMSLLRRGGFVRSIRGQVGGYELARKPSEIAIGEVLAYLGGRLFEPGFCLTHSGGDEECTHNSDCSVRSVWMRIQLAVDHALGRISVEDLLIGSEQELIRLQPARSPVNRTQT
jgi:Rrf2 family protein